MPTATQTETCRHGHERTQENTFVGTDGRVRCRECRRVNSRARAERRSRHHPREVLHEVPNELLRERFLELQRLDRVNAQSVAAALGWYGTKRQGREMVRKPDGSRVLKRLGLMAQDGRIATTVRYETAVAIGGALGMEPYEGGY